MSASAVNPGLIHPLREERVLLWCVLASIALHALALLGFPAPHALAPSAKSTLVLTARLAPVATAPRAQSPAPSPKPAAVSPPPTTSPRPKPAPVPRPVHSTPTPALAPAAPKKVPAAAPKTAPPESAPEPAVPPSPVSSAAPGTAAPGQSALGQTGSGQAGSGQSGSGKAGSASQAPVGIKTEAGARSSGDADNGTLEKYRLALIAATRRYKRYPAIAMEKGWQGRVVVRMEIGANGMLAKASIKTSSGHEILDNQAIDMLKKGKTTVQIPASLRSRAFSVDVPVIFNLDNPSS